MDIIDIVLSKKYTDESLKGITGTLAGKNCTIKSATKADGVTTVVFAWTADDGTEKTTTIQVNDGTDDYEDLINKPKIEGVDLIGNKTFEDLGVASATDLAQTDGHLQDLADLVGDKVKLPMPNETMVDNIEYVNTKADGLKGDLYELSSDIDELIFNQKYFYRFLQWEQGEYIGTSGIKTDSSDDNYLKRVRSDLIKCDSGIVVTFICDTNYIYNIHIWDNNKEFVKSSGLVQNTENFSYKIDGDYFSLSVRRTDYAYITPESMSNSVIQPYSYKNFKVINETDLSQSLKDSLLTKTTTVRNTNILSFGDSIAKGIGNRIDGVPTSYARIIAQLYDVEDKLYDYSVGGKCMSGKWKDGVVNQVETAVNEHKNDGFSLIFLEGGTNDITLNITIGEVGTSYNPADFDDTTFCGALEKSIYLITTTWSKSKLIFIMPHHMAALDQTKQKEQHDKIIEICTKWGVPVADVYAYGGMNTCIEEMAVYYCNYKSGEPFDRDTAHPNDIGYKKCYVPLIEKLI